MKNTPPQYFSVFKTPLGVFAVAVNDQGEVTAAVFGDRTALSRRLGGIPLVEDKRRAAQARAQLTSWFQGKLRSFSIELRPAGTPYQRRVWSALSAIPYGETRSYGDVAKGLRTSPRAVGRANATNPICVIIPCHRVIGADGSLTGYAFGENTKRRLLEFEGAAISGP